MTFLVTYYAHPELLRVCIGSIKKFYPKVRIVVSQQINDMEIPEDITGFELITHDMRHDSWAGACIGLMKACGDDIGVFMEHDCTLLKPINDLIKKMDEYDLIGTEELIPGLRNSPGYANQNFFILDCGKFVKKWGYGAVWVNPMAMIPKPQNVESGYGITQHSEKILFLQITPSGYAHGTYYGDYVHHMWFGSYRERNVAVDGVSFIEMEIAVNNFIKDYELCNLNPKL